jgi:hypothetical protein
MMDELRERIRAWMAKEGWNVEGTIYTVAVQAAESEVARKEEQHAKERAAWMQAGHGIEQLHAEDVRCMKKEAEAEKQAAVAAALAAERAAETERVLGIVSEFGFGTKGMGQALADKLYPPAKVTLLPAGWYWARLVDDSEAQRGWEMVERKKDGNPTPGWEYVKAEPPPNPYAEKAEEPVKFCYAESVKACESIGPHHGDKCNGGRVQSPNAQFTQDCPACKGSGKHSPARKRD